MGVPTAIKRDQCAGAWSAVELAVVVAFACIGIICGAAEALTGAISGVAPRDGQTPGVVYADTDASRRQLRRRLYAMAVSRTCRPALARPSQRIRRRP